MSLRWFLPLMVTIAIGIRPHRQAATEYRLPYPVGDRARLIQGNNGPWGHSEHAAFAYDFIMPIGSPVTAARPGRVIAVEGSFHDGSRKPATRTVRVKQCSSALRLEVTWISLDDMPMRGEGVSNCTRRAGVEQDNRIPPGRPIASR